MTERELLVDCLRRLNRAAVSYMLTGSMVSNYWWIPRTTHDLDFVVQLPPTDVDRLVAEFRGDYYVDEVSIRSAYQPPHQFNMIDTRSALKVDFWLLKPDRQLGDAAGVIAVQGGKLDLEYLWRWARELRLTAQMESLLTGKIRPKQT